MEFLKEVKLIIIHHSGSLDSFEKIKNFHINKNGWEDIGYHWVIDKNGNLLEGRNEKFIGAHCLGQNRNSLGVCLIGNFEFETPTEKQIQILIEFLKKKMNKFNISLENVFGHRKISEKEGICPGRFLDLEKIRANLKQ